MISRRSKNHNRSASNRNKRLARDNSSTQKTKVQVSREAVRKLRLLPGKLFSKIKGSIVSLQSRLHGFRTVHATTDAGSVVALSGDLRNSPQLRSEVQADIAQLAAHRQRGRQENAAEVPDFLVLKVRNRPEEVSQAKELVRDLVEDLNESGTLSRRYSISESETEPADDNTMLLTSRLEGDAESISKEGRRREPSDTSEDATTAQPSASAAAGGSGDDPNRNNDGDRGSDHRRDLIDLDDSHQEDSDDTEDEAEQPVAPVIHPNDRENLQNVLQNQIQPLRDALDREAGEQRDHPYMRDLLQRLDRLQQLSVKRNLSVNDLNRAISEVEGILHQISGDQVAPVFQNDAMDRQFDALWGNLQTRLNDLKSLERDNERQTKKKLAAIFHALKRHPDLLEQGKERNLFNYVYSFLGVEDEGNSPYNRQSREITDEELISNGVFAEPQTAPKKEFDRRVEAHMRQDGSLSREEAEAIVDREFQNLSQAEFNALLRSAYNRGDYFFVRHPNRESMTSDARLILNLSDQRTAMRLAEFIRSQWGQEGAEADWRGAITDAKFYARSSNNRRSALKYDKMVVYLDATQQQAVVAGVRRFLADRLGDPNDGLQPDISAFYDRLGPGIGAGEDIDPETSFTEIRTNHLIEFIKAEIANFPNNDDAGAFADAAFQGVMARRRQADQ